ncbi:hypothetical protein H9P43_004624 [Blastocladiella emersonii ATCC 22665]|nr:hypothetical protein H9P43_004624 [Blastocladiella emersonii ATCC 22665]
MSTPTPRILPGSPLRPTRVSAESASEGMDSHLSIYSNGSRDSLTAAADGSKKKKRRNSDVAAENGQVPVQQPLTRSRRCICLSACAVFFVLSLVFALIAYFVLIPKLVKARLEDPDLLKKAQEARQSDPDRVKVNVDTFRVAVGTAPGVTVQIKAAITTSDFPVPVSVRVEPGTWAVALDGGEKPAIDIRIPELKLSSGAPIEFNLDDTIRFLDVERIGQLVREFVTDEGLTAGTGRFAVRSTLQYAVFGVPMKSIDLDIRVPAEGLNFKTIQKALTPAPNAPPQPSLLDKVKFAITKFGFNVQGTTLILSPGIDLDNQTPFELLIARFAFSLQLETLDLAQVSLSALDVKPGKSSLAPEIRASTSLKLPDLINIARVTATERRLPNVVVRGPFDLAGRSREGAVAPAEWFKALTDGLTIAIPLSQLPMPGAGDNGMVTLTKLLSVVSVTVDGRGSKIAIGTKAQVDLPKLPFDLDMSKTSVAFSIFSGSASLFRIEAGNIALRPAVGVDVTVTPSMVPESAAQLAAALKGERALDISVRELVLGGAAFDQDLVIPIPIEFNLESIRAAVDRARAEASTAAPSPGQMLEFAQTLVRDVKLSVAPAQPEARVDLTATPPAELLRDFAIDIPVTVSALVRRGGVTDAELLTVTFNSTLKKAEAVPLAIVTTLSNSQATQDRLASFVAGANANDRLVLTGLKVGEMTLFAQIPFAEVSRADIVKVLQTLQNQAAQADAAAPPMAERLAALLAQVKSASVSSPRAAVLSANATVQVPKVPLLAALSYPAISLNASANGAAVAGIRVPPGTIAPDAAFSPGVDIELNESEATQAKLAQITAAQPIPVGVSGLTVGGIRTFSAVRFDMDLPSVQSLAAAARQRTPAAPPRAEGGGTPPSSLPVRDVSLKVSETRPEAVLEATVALGEQFAAVPFSVNVPFSVDAMLGTTRLAQVAMSAAPVTQAAPRVSIVTTFADSQEAKARVAAFVRDDKSADRIEVRSVQVAGAKTFSRIAPFSVSRQDLVAMVGAARASGDGQGAASIAALLKDVKVTAPADRSEILADATVGVPQLPLPVPVAVQVPPIAINGMLNDINVMQIRTTVPAFTAQGAGTLKPAVVLAFDSSTGVQDRVAGVNFASASVSATGLRVGGIRTFEQAAITLPVASLAAMAGGNAAGGDAAARLAKLPIRDTSVVVSDTAPRVDLRTVFAVPAGFFDATAIEVAVPVSAGVDLSGARIASFASAGKITKQSAVPLSATINFADDNAAKDQVAAAASAVAAMVMGGAPATGKIPDVAVRGVQIGGVQTFSKLAIVQMSGKDVEGMLKARLSGAANGGGVAAALSMIKSVKVAAPADASVITVDAALAMPALPVPAATVEIPAISLAAFLNDIPVANVRTTVPKVNTAAGAELVRPAIAVNFDSSAGVQDRVAALNAANTNAVVKGLRVGGIRTFETVSIAMKLPVPDVNAIARGSNGAGGAARQALPIKDTAVLLSEQAPTVDLRTVFTPPANLLPFDVDVTVPIRAGVDLGNARIVSFTAPGRVAKAEGGNIPLAAALAFSDDGNVKGQVASFASSLVASVIGGGDGAAPPAPPAESVTVRGVSIGGINTFSKLELVKVSGRDMVAIAQSLIASGSASGSTGNPADRLAAFVQGVTVAPAKDKPALAVSASMSTPQFSLVQSIDLPSMQAVLSVNDARVTTFRVSPGRVAPGQAAKVAVDVQFETSEDTQRRVAAAGPGGFKVAAAGIRVGGIRTFEQVSVAMTVDPTAALTRQIRAFGDVPPQAPVQAQEGPAKQQVPALTLMSVAASPNSPAINVDSRVGVPDAVAGMLASPLLESAAIGPIKLAVSAGNARFMNIDLGNVPVQRNAKELTAPLSIGFDNSPAARGAMKAFVASLQSRETTGSTPIRVQGLAFGDPASPITTFSQVAVEVPVQVALDAAAARARASQPPANRRRGGNANNNNGGGDDVVQILVQQLIATVIQRQAVQVQSLRLAQRADQPMIEIDPVLRIREPGGMINQASIGMFSMQLMMNQARAIRIDAPNGVAINGQQISSSVPGNGNGNAATPLNLQIAFDNSAAAQDNTAAVLGPLVKVVLSNSTTPESQRGTFGATGLVFGGKAAAAQIQTFSDVQVDLRADKVVTTALAAFASRNSTSGGALGSILKGAGTIKNVIKPGSTSVRLRGLGVEASATLDLPLGFPLSIATGPVSVDATVKGVKVLDVMVPPIAKPMAATGDIRIEGARVGLNTEGRLFGAIASATRIMRNLLAGSAEPGLGVTGIEIGAANGAGAKELTPGAAANIQTFKKVSVGFL